MTCINASTAARKLKDILAWQHKPWTPQETISSPRLDQNRGSSEKPLPFHIDNLDNTGNATGVETTTGVTMWLHYWAAWLDFWIATPPTGDPSPWLLKQLEEHPDLQNAHLPPPKPHEDATADEWDTYQTDLTWHEEWCLFTRELNQLWWRIANRVGHAPLNRIPCPKCQAGWIQSQYDNQGLSDQAACTNSDCATQLDYSDEEIAAAFRATLRTITEPTWITIQDVHTIWGNRIKDGTLRRWVHEGHVRKKDGRYNLADINRKKWDTK